MTKPKDDKFDSFFEIHSQNVDNANNQGFWKLSDTIVERFLLETMTKRHGVTVVDFGGGTGRWFERLDSYFKDSQFYIVDLSKDMLSVAEQKIKANKFNNQLTLIHSDIANVPDFADNTADYIISTYNPISFVADPQKVVNEAFRILKPGGKVMIMTQAWHNALYSKIMNYNASTTELKNIFTNKKLTWNDFVPETWQLSQQDMEKLFTKAGFKNIESRGIACLIQPQDEDWDQSNQKIGPLSHRLETDTEFFDTILDMELNVGRNQSAVNRGMNIMTIGQKD